MINLNDYNDISHILEEAVKDGRLHYDEEYPQWTGCLVRGVGTGEVFLTSEDTYASFVSWICDGGDKPSEADLFESSMISLDCYLCGSPTDFWTES